jgi:hypothetical protein
MMTQIAYLAVSLNMLASLALPAHAHHHCPTDYANPLCVPAGATEGDDQSSAQRGTGR